MTESRSSLDAALDVLVYAPLGLALTAAEEVPKLAAKGRQRITGQVAVARMVGQYAVSQGRKQIEQVLAPSAPDPSAAPAPVPPSAAAPAAPAPWAPTATPASPVVEPVPPATPVEVEQGSGDTSSEASTSPGATFPAADHLAIPGYDSLSASQVVQRLAGLSAEELQAVGAYEEATRCRRTILTRVHQLQES